MVSSHGLPLKGPGAEQRLRRHCPPAVLAVRALIGILSSSDSSFQSCYCAPFQFIPRVSRGNQNQQYLPSTIQIPSPNPCSSRRLSLDHKEPPHGCSLQLCHALGHKACSAWPYLHHVTLDHSFPCDHPVDHKGTPHQSKSWWSFPTGQKNIAFSEHMLSKIPPKTLPPIPVSLCQKRAQGRISKLFIAILHLKHLLFPQCDPWLWNHERLLNKMLMEKCKNESG